MGTRYCNFALWGCHLIRFAVMYFSGRHRRALGVFFQISWRKAVCNTLCSYTCRQNQNLSNKRCSVPIRTLQQLQLVVIRATGPVNCSAN